MRRTLLCLVFLGLLVAPACSEGDTLFQETGTLKLLVADRTLASQVAETRTNQFTQWKVRKAEMDIPGVGTVDLLSNRTVQSCQVEQRGLGYQDFCRLGVALAPGPGMVTVRVEIDELFVIRAERPELTATGDLDEDGVLDLEDNCPFVSNADQANENEEDEDEDARVGDLCTNANGFKDSDGDTIADLIDNCVYKANPLQEAAPETSKLFTTDGVGTACEEKIQVMIPPGTVIRKVDQAFTIRDQGATNVVLDFNTKTWCGHGEDTCTLTSDDVIVTAQ